MDFNETWEGTCSAVGLAARNGDIEVLKRLIQLERPLDGCDNRGWRPLHEAAASSKNIHCLEELLKHGSDVNWKTHEGETALLLICKRRNDTDAYEAVKLVLDKGADPNIEDNDLETPLLSATRAVLENTVNLLITSPNLDVNKGDFSGWRPLHQATNLGNINMINAMLKAGAQLDVQDECGMTPLFTAAQFGKYECLKLLLETAKDRDQLDLVNRGAQDWATPLMIAAQQGFLNCVELLLSYNANPNLKTFDNVTALHLAVQGKNDDVLKVLLNVMDLEALKKNCILQIEKKENRYRALNRPEMINPLQLSIEWHSYKCLELLLEAGFPVNSLFSRTELPHESYFPMSLPPYDTPLSLAANYRDLEAIQILLNAGANCNSTCALVLHPLIADALGKTQHDNQILDLLVEKGAYVNYHRRGPLANDCLLAASWKPSKLVRLLTFGADPTMFFTDSVSSSVLVESLFRSYQSQEEIIRVFDIFTLFTLSNKIMYDAIQAASEVSQEKFGDEHDERSWENLLNRVSLPQTLKSLSRIKIRKYFYALYRTALENNLKRLNVPVHLTNYLCYKELNYED